MIRITLAFAATLLFAVPTLALAQNVLDAEPTVRVDSNEDAAKRRVLSTVERAESKIIIIKKGGHYLWASREGRELIHEKSGAVDYFIDPRGGGYIKVIDSHYVPADARTKGPRYEFMEHVTLLLHTITYWGTTNRFDLEP